MRFYKSLQGTIRLYEVSLGFLEPGERIPSDVLFLGKAWFSLKKNIVFLGKSLVFVEKSLVFLKKELFFPGKTLIWLGKTVSFRGKPLFSLGFGELGKIMLSVCFFSGQA